jgi:hypothetical protein
MDSLAEKFLCSRAIGDDIKGVVLMVDYDGALRKLFSDWKKLLIGVLLSIFPVIRWFVKGYMFENTGLGKHKKMKTLPEWKNWQQLFINGFAGTVIAFLYIVPAILVLIIGVGTTFLGWVDNFVQTAAYVGLTNGVMEAGPAQQILPTVVNSWPLLAPHLLKAAPMLVAALLLWIGAAYLLPLGILNFLKTGRMEDAFQFEEISKVAMTKQYLVVWLVVSLSAALAIYSLTWIPLIGWAAAYYLVGVFGFTLFGEVHKEVA